MEIRKSKYHYFLNALTIFVIMLFLYIFIRDINSILWEKWRNGIDSFLVFGLGFLGLYRLYYLDVYIKLSKKESPVDFWIFYNDLLKNNFSMSVMKIFIVRPFSFKENKIENRKALNKANYSCYMLYIFFICLIINVLIKR